MKQDRMTTVRPQSPSPLRAVEPITAPDADPIDHADQGVTDAMSREINEYLRRARAGEQPSRTAPELLMEAFRQFADATALFGVQDGGTLTFTAPGGTRTISVDLSPFAARKVAKSLLLATQDASAYAGLAGLQQGLNRPRLVVAPVQS